MPFKGQKFNFQVIMNDFLYDQDPFTKSDGHMRDLVWPIHMPYKNRG